MIYAILLQWKLLDQLSSGAQVLSRTANSEYCSQEWWSLVGLYGNLFKNIEKNCMGQLWYIQCDFQFHALTKHSVTMNDTYFKPWTRMGTYWAGVLGMMIVQSTYERYVSNRFNYILISSIRAFILLSLAFWPYQDVVNAPEKRWNLSQNMV